MLGYLIQHTSPLKQREQLVWGPAFVHAFGLSLRLSARNRPKPGSRDGQFRFAPSRSSCPRPQKYRRLSMVVRQVGSHVLSTEDSVVAARTFTRRGAVEENFFAFNESEALVTFITFHLQMRALQREIRLCFMIEQ